MNFMRQTNAFLEEILWDFKKILYIEFGWLTYEWVSKWPLGYLGDSD